MQKQSKYQILVIQNLKNKTYILFFKLRIIKMPLITLVQNARSKSDNIVALLHKPSMEGLFSNIISK